MDLENALYSLNCDPVSPPPGWALPADVLEMLESTLLWSELPPLGEGARQLFALQDKDKEDSKILALVAQNDPIYLGRLLCLANGAAGYTQGTPITTAEAAVRKLGTRDTYAVMQACAVVASFAGLKCAAPYRRYLLNYLVSTSLTARNLAQWLELDAPQSGWLTLGVLLAPTGLYAALLADSCVARRFSDTLSRVEGAALRLEEGLHGYLLLSSRVARAWQAPDEVAEAIADSGAAYPATSLGRLLAATEALVHAKNRGLDQAAALQPFIDPCRNLQAEAATLKLRLGVCVTSL